ncbi:50S ribosomal protein L4 [Halobacteriales archaeon QS_8_69_26]|nr:MAG: 50S ribosomal protein L4 [Halobacteriales archaeon QS_8_69_26]
MTDATVLDLDGDEEGSVGLPDAFDAVVRPDLIRRAVLAAQANRKQDHGADPEAGLRTTAESFGSGRGMAHVPRSEGRGRRVPQTVGGRRAHPPKAEKDHSLDINDKERKQATRSAVAATADAELVEERGHRFDDGVAFPVVVSDAFEDLVKTQAVVDTLESLGLADDVTRAEEGRTVRSGRGKTRGRKYRTPASICFVTSSDAGPSKAARNLCGATVTTAREVNAEDLAPGGHPGRLTVWTESAVEEVGER